MVVCPHCKKFIPDGAMFCPQCGKEISFKKIKNDNEQHGVIQQVCSNNTTKDSNDKKSELKFKSDIEASKKKHTIIIVISIVIVIVVATIIVGFVCYTQKQGNNVINSNETKDYQKINEELEQALNDFDLMR